MASAQKPCGIHGGHSTTRRFILLLDAGHSISNGRIHTHPLHTIIIKNSCINDPCQWLTNNFFYFSYLHVPSSKSASTSRCINTDSLRTIIENSSLYTIDDPYYSFLWSLDTIVFKSISIYTLGHTHRYLTGIIPHTECIKCGVNSLWSKTSTTPTPFSYSPFSHLSISDAFTIIPRTLASYATAIHLRDLSITQPSVEHAAF